ncbi:MAG: MBL fold metallo-hydrolase [Phycisphaerales bacterium]|nr:MBL fold metallo-hydrolase [Phycisphaerales bacterium]
MIVTPERETILIDGGWPIERDAQRILDALRDTARRPRIDHMIVTHWHTDHYGAITLLGDRVEFGQFYDRGLPEAWLLDPAQMPDQMRAYQRLTSGPTITMAAGDEIPLRQGLIGPRLRLRCLMASGRVDENIAGSPNPYCAQHEDKGTDLSENGLSIVLLLSYGPFDFFLGGDLTWNFERDLVCPKNRVGQVELFQVNHHGLRSSNNPVLVHALAPRTAVMFNGPEKGADQEVLETLRRSPGIQDFWQLHRNTRLSATEQAPSERVANPDDPEGGRAIRVSVGRGGQVFRIWIDPGGEPAQYSCW